MNIRTKFILIGLLFIANSALSEQKNAHDSYAKKLLRSLGIAQDNVSISVKDMDTNEGIISFNAGKLLNPASNIKILTSYCALKRLGVNYRWKTKVYRSSSDIYIKGSGDPYMVSESLWMLAKKFLNKGIDQIKGDLILDSSMFDWKSEPSAFKSDYGRSFTAKPGALSLNFNSVTIYVRASKPGQPPSVTLDPDLDYFVIDNRGKSVSASVRTSPKLGVEKLKGKTKIRITGKWGPSTKKVHYRKVFHPEIYFGSAFERFYSSLGGRFKGKIRTGPVPRSAKEIFEFESRPLSRSIWGLNKFSNNFMASQIMLTMALEEFGAPATKGKGLSALESCFYSLGLQKKGNRITSASGLSRDTRISAGQITEILIRTGDDFSISPEFISSLGIYGDDGTVRRRDPAGDLRGRVRVKTGNLEGVDALSGYLKTKNSKYLAFSMIGNGFKESKRHKYRELQDKLIHYLFNNL